MKDNYKYKQRKEKKSLMLKKKREKKENQWNKSSLTKEKECCKFDKIFTERLKKLTLWSFRYY